MRQKNWFALGCSVAVLGLCGLLFVPLPFLLAKGQNVEAAFTTSFPDVCNEWRDKLVVEANVVSWFTVWEVSCRHGFTPDTTRLMSVNTLLCWANPPIQWPTSVAALRKFKLSSGQPMPRCP
jgi:hypothetical protein